MQSAALSVERRLEKPRKSERTGRLPGLSCSPKVSSSEDCSPGAGPPHSTRRGDRLTYCSGSPRIVVESPPYNECILAAPICYCVSSIFFCSRTARFLMSPAKYSKKALSLPNPLHFLYLLVDRTMLLGQRWQRWTSIHCVCRARHLASGRTPALGKQAQRCRLVISRLQARISFRYILNLMTWRHLFGHRRRLFAGWYRSDVSTRLLL